MPRAFSLEVVTPAGRQVKAEAESVVLPGAAGSLGVLNSHEPWTVLLKRGAVSYRASGGGWKNFEIGGGVASIEGNATLVLADPA